MDDDTPPSKRAERERSRRYYWRNREAIRARTKAKREATKDRQRQRYVANREAIRARARAYYEANREAIKEKSRKHYAANREANSERRRRYHAAHREVVFGHYGTSCACCGTTERLTIDHINGDGGDHREQLFGNRNGNGGLSFYRWLIAQDFPPGYQALCMPCNVSKKDGPRCRLDHKKDA